MWISVKDRLPSRMTFVAVFKTTKPNIIGCYFNGRGKFKYATSDHTKDVTHWQPFPEPPKL